MAEQGTHYQEFRFKYSLGKQLQVVPVNPFGQAARQVFEPTSRNWPVIHQIQFPEASISEQVL